MSKRKGKRIREPGSRLTTLSEDITSEEIQDRLLRDAGVDDEMIKDIPDTEKKAIIKAILESNPELNRQVVVKERHISPQNGSVESPSASGSGDCEETQPPEVIEVSESPRIPDAPEGRKASSDYLQDDDRPGQEILDTETPNGFHQENSDSSCHSPQTRDDAACKVQEPIPSIQEAIPPSEPWISSTVLEVETQFCPSPRESQGDIEMIPESPSSVKLTEESRYNKNYLPRYCFDSGKDPSVYTPLIKLMFDIYIRRLRSVQRCLKSGLVDWGEPVKKGNHCENILRRETLELREAENVNKKATAKRVSKRKQVKDDDSSDSNSNNDLLVDRKKKFNSKSCQSVLEEDFSMETTSRSVIMDNPEKGNGSPDQDCLDVDPHWSPATRDCMKRFPAPEADISVSKTMRDRCRKKDQDIITIEAEEGTVHSSHRVESKSPVLETQCEKIIETVVQVDADFEADEGPSGSKAGLRTWLKSDKPVGVKRGVGRERKSSKSKKRRSDCPRVAEFREENKVECRKSKSQCSDEPLCVIDGADSSFLPDVDGCKGEELQLIEDKRVCKSQMCEIVESVVDVESKSVDAVPGSSESGHLLNAEGDMYCTQVVSRSRKAQRKKTPDIIEAGIENHIPDTDSTLGRLYSDKSRVKKKKVCFESDSEICSENGVHDKRKIKKFKTERDNLEKNVGCISATNERKNSERGGSKFVEKLLNVDVFSDPNKELVSQDEDNRRNKVSKRKKKRTLFDADSYELAGNSSQSLGRRKDSACVNEIPTENELLDNRIILSDEDTDDLVHTNLPTAGDKPGESTSDKGCCPICNGMFPLKELEAHASSCGEVSGVDERLLMETVKCMICRKEINRSLLREHQTQCSKAGGTEEDFPTQRVTRRANRSGSEKKNVFSTRLKEKSPSSSGEDYGELLVEVDTKWK